MENILIFIPFEGVPPGSVLSTTLFIVGISGLAHQLQPRVQYSVRVNDFFI